MKGEIINNKHAPGETPNPNSLKKRGENPLHRKKLNPSLIFKKGGQNGATALGPRYNPKNKFLARIFTRASSLFYSDFNIISKVVFVPSVALRNKAC
jgi:hypothetical protein